MTDDEVRQAQESVSLLIAKEVERRLREMIPVDTQKVIDDLLAELSQLRETVRKLAVITNGLVKIDMGGAAYRHVHGQSIDYGDLPELLKDPHVAAALKEAEND